MTTESIPGTVLYERFMSAGPAVRIRRTSAEGEHPVVAVLEVDRRALTPRTSRGAGLPPSLLQIEGDSDRDVVNVLKPHADSDATIARMMAERGLR